MKILFVEDEHIVKLAVLRHLKAKGYDILYAENGQEALEMIRQDMPDLVISDILMPVMDGIELARKIRAEFGINIPIILASALLRSDFTREIKELYIDKFFTKPFALDDLTGYIESMDLA